MAENAENMEVEQPDNVGDDLREVIDKLETATDDFEDDAIEAEEQDAAPEETAEEVPEKEAAEKEGEQVSEPVAKGYKAPIDWGPKLKQEFKNLPESVQKAIHDREVSINNVFQQTAQERRTANEFNRVVSEFSGLMAAEGVQDPLQGVRGLLMTTAQLAMGNPQMKAQKIAQLIRHYGVDIQTLDSVLVGDQPKAQQPQPVSDPRLDYVFNRLQQAERSAQQNMTQKAHQNIHEFGADAQNEFFEDVRYDMADLLEMAAHRGQQMSLKKAYDIACNMNPEIAQIVADRKAQQRGTTSAQRAAQKANAASSITGKAGTSNEGGSDLEGASIREILDAQFSSTGRV